MNESGRVPEEKTNVIAPGFHTINPDTRLTTQTPPPVNSVDPKLSSRNVTILPHSGVVRTLLEKPTILGTCFIITHVCLGNFSIFSFSQKTKSFGLFWMIFFTIIIGLINYWAIMRSFFASIKCKDSNYSQVTEQFLGIKARKFLNILIIGYSFLCMMYLIGLTFPLIGRIIKILAYNNQYQSYNTFLKEKWGKDFIKYPFFICVGFCVYIISYFKFIKLRFIGFFRMITFSLCILILIIQSNSYYKYYKETIFKSNDKNTYTNWTNLKNAFSSKMDFFKGLCILFASYTCMPIMFPIFEGFKSQEKPFKKTRTSVILGTLLTTVLTIISIICSYLINPYSPEEFVFFRKNKNNGKDILLVITNFFIVICLILTAPRYYLMLKINFKFLFFKDKNKLTGKLNNFFTFIFCLGSAFASIYFDGFLSYLCYIGGFFSVFISYLFPALIYAKSSGKNIKYWNNLIHIIFAFILCVIGLIGGISTLVDDITH